jgi:hypothetical protein
LKQVRNHDSLKNGAFLTYAYGVAGETNEALQAFAKLTQLSETRFVEPVGWQ